MAITCVTKIRTHSRRGHDVHTPFPLVLRFRAPVCPQALQLSTRSMGHMTWCIGRYVFAEHVSTCAYMHLLCVRQACYGTAFSSTSVLQVDGRLHVLYNLKEWKRAQTIDA